MDISHPTLFNSALTQHIESAADNELDGEQFAPHGDLRICYQRMGPANAPPVLLIMGLGGQLISWPMTLCDALLGAGFQVIRFDNRDSGRSSRFDAAGDPQLLRVAGAAALRRRVRVPYQLADMARDALAVLDHLALPAAHIVGVSMGGMIGQILAAQHAPRVLSLSSVMSTSGDPRLPGPSPALKLWMIRRRNGDPSAVMREMVRGLQMVGSPGFRRSDAELRETLRPQLERGLCPQGTRRQLAAILACGSRTRLLPNIQAPTLVIHGADDRLIPFAAAVDLGRRIAHARVEIVPGLGHDLPDAVMPRIADSLIRHFHCGPAASLANAA